jgi:hypothetical protein
MGFRALIAHPERHLSDDIAERIGGLIERGALIQATAAYLVGGGEREGMLALARRGLIHVLASDAHSSHRGRPLRISEGLAALEGVEMLRPHLDWIAEEAPAAILREMSRTSVYDLVLSRRRATSALSSSISRRRASSRGRDGGS